jgi:DNA-binding transcriptional ArsR family regulator
MAGRKYYATERQIEAFVNSRRVDIFQHLAALGPLSAIELAELLALPVTSLYHHLKALVAAGVVEEVNRKGAGQGRPAKAYRAMRRALYLTEGIEQPHRRKLVARIIRSAASQATREFNAALSDDKTSFTGPNKNISHLRAAFVASDTTLVRVNALLEELRIIALAPTTHSGELLTLTWFMSVPRRKKKRAAK